MGNKTPKEGYKEHIELTLQIGCKANCSYCPQSLFIKRYFETSNEDYPIEMMTLEMVKKYIKSVPKKLIVSLAGFAEPLANPEIVEIYRFLKNDGRIVDINTTLYNVERQTIKDLLKEDIRFFQLHVPDNNNLTKIKVDKKYLRNLRYTLINLQRKPNAKIVITCLGENLHPEVENILDKYPNLINNSNIGHEFINDRAGLLSDSIAFKHQRNIGEMYCCKTNRSLHYTNILPDGRITLCCMDFGLNNVLGSLNHQTYKEILTGKEANHIRKEMVDDNINIICRTCEFGVEGKPPAIPIDWQNKTIEPLEKGK